MSVDCGLLKARVTLLKKKYIVLLNIPVSLLTSEILDAYHQFNIGIVTRYFDAFFAVYRHWIMFGVR
jgi:hypothetical protein